eukprot:TRINITY_DN2109_c0_g2_i1.p1 TRINITY_DN2109_c0_g2~~TRINITY_DN2109_c0_g2_i1.p1  ORF type:complete len:305 (+),score=57.70 TRINITY_DN2109_c0_g2_i1:135-1049(+)
MAKVFTEVSFEETIINELKNPEKADLDTLRYCVENIGETINFLKYDNKNLIVHLIEKYYPEEIIEIMVKDNPDITYFYPIIVAIKKNCPAIVRLYCQHLNFRINKMINNTYPISFAACKGSAACIGELLENPYLDPNIKDHFIGVDTPLNNAIISNNLSAVTALLSHPDIDVNLIGTNKLTPLGTSIVNCNNRFFELLLAHENIDVNKKYDGKRYYHALGHIVCKNIYKMFTRLIEHPDINPDQSFFYGSWKCNILDVAEHNDFGNIFNTIKTHEKTKHLQRSVEFVVEKPYLSSKTKVSNNSD